MQTRDTDRVTVSVPSWRNDIAAGVSLDQAPDLDANHANQAAQGAEAVEAEADLIEEVLRLRGLDSIPPVSLPVPGVVPGPTLTPRQARTALVRRTLAAQGLVECVTFSFMATAEAALFGETPETLRVANPIAADLDQMRPTPLAGLALAASRNAARGWPDVALFEIGPAFSAEARRRDAGRGRPPRRHHRAQLGRTVPPARRAWTPRRTSTPRWKPSRCRWRRSASPPMPPASTTPGAPAWSAKGRK